MAVRGVQKWDVAVLQVAHHSPVGHAVIAPQAVPGCS